MLLKRVAADSDALEQRQLPHMTKSRRPSTGCNNMNEISTATIAAVVSAIAPHESARTKACDSTRRAHCSVSDMLVKFAWSGGVSMTGPAPIEKFTVATR